MKTQKQQQQVEIGKEVNNEIKEEAVLLSADMIPSEEKIKGAALNNSRSRNHEGETEDQRLKREKTNAKRREARARRAALAKAALQEFEPTMEEVANAVLGPIDPSIIAGDVQEPDGFLPEAPNGMAIDPEIIEGDLIELDDEDAEDDDSGEDGEEKIEKEQPIVLIKKKSKKTKGKVAGMIAAYVAKTPFGLKSFKVTERQMSSVFTAIRKIEACLRAYTPVRTEAMKATGKLPNSNKFIVENFNDLVKDALESFEGVVPNPESAFYFRGQPYCDKHNITNMIELFEMAPDYSKERHVNLVGFYEALYQVMQVYYRAAKNKKVYFFWGHELSTLKSEPEDPVVAAMIKLALPKLKTASAKAGYPIHRDPDTRKEDKRNAGIDFPASFKMIPDVDEDGKSIKVEAPNQKYDILIKRFKKLMLRELNFRLALEQGRSERKAASEALKNNQPAPKPTPYEKLEVLPGKEDTFIDSFGLMAANKWLNASQLAAIWELTISLNYSGEDAKEFRTYFVPVIKDYLWDRLTLMGNTVDFHQYLVTTLGDKDIFDPAELNKHIDEAKPKGVLLYVNPNAFKKEEDDKKGKKAFKNPRDVIKAAVEAAEGGDKTKEEIKKVLSSLVPVNGDVADHHAELNQADEDVEELHNLYS